MIHLVTERATEQQIKDMLELYETYFKVAVDVKRVVLAGGGEFHADCESILLEHGSRREDIWGADWVPDRQEVRYSALINIRPKQNRAMEIQDSGIREIVERIVRNLLQRT